MKKFIPAQKVRMISPELLNKFECYFPGRYRRSYHGTPYKTIEPPRVESMIEFIDSFTRGNYSIQRYASLSSWRLHSNSPLIIRSIKDGKESEHGEIEAVCEFQELVDLLWDITKQILKVI